MTRVDQVETKENTGTRPLAEMLAFAVADVRRTRELLEDLKSKAEAMNGELLGLRTAVRALPCLPQEKFGCERCQPDDADVCPICALMFSLGEGVTDDS